MTATQAMSQDDVDRVTYDMYVHVGCDARRAAHELGVTPRTVTARVSRHTTGGASFLRAERRERRRIDEVLRAVTP